MKKWLLAVGIVVFAACGGGDVEPEQTADLPDLPEAVDGVIEADYFESDAPGPVDEPADIDEPVDATPAGGGEFRGRFTMTYTTYGAFGNEYIYFGDDGTFSFTGMPGTFTVTENVAAMALPGIDWDAVMDGNTITIADPFSDAIMVFERD